MAGAEAVRTAFVLGAGRGTRLRPLTDEWPKPLLPVRGRPLITYALDQLVEFGIEQLIINTHHRAERFKAIFPEEMWQGVPIQFRHEPELLETGGGLKNIEDLIEGERLIVFNGDILSSLPLDLLVEEHLSRGNEVTLAVRSEGGPLHIGLDERTGLVRDIRGEHGVHGLKSCLFSGIYVVERAFLSRLRPGEKCSVIPVFHDMIRSQARLGAVVLDQGEWCDVGTLEVYEQLNNPGRPVGARARPKVIFFDAAGTLIKTAEAVGTVYARAAAQLGWDRPAAVFDEAFREAWRWNQRRPPSAGPRPHDDREWWKDLVERTLRAAAEGGTVRLRKDAFFERVYADFAEPSAWTPYFEAAGVLSELRSRGYRLGVISNFDSRLINILNGLDLGRHFEAVIVSSQAGAEKPHRQIFERALAAVGVAPGEALHVGDEVETDIEGAREAGLQTFHLDRARMDLREVLNHLEMSG